MSPSFRLAKQVEIIDIREDDLKFSLAEDIYAGLSPEDGGPRSLPTMLLYDTKGLQLFEEITYLDEYYLTDAEIEVLTASAVQIVDRIPDNAQLLELGSGNLRKIEILLKEFEKAKKRVDYYALDLSLSELQRTFSEISVDDFAYVGFHGLHGTYDNALTWLSRPENRERPTGVMSLGSSLGNFSRPDAARFLRGFAKLLAPPDFMIVGLDACKDSDKVYRAYNDSKGITQQFYQNGLAHANLILGYEAFKPSEWQVVTDFDVRDGKHQAFFSPTQDVTIKDIHIRKGEKIIFEEAVKWGTEERDVLWHDAGLICGASFANSSNDYHIHLLSPATLSLSTRAAEYAAAPVPSLDEFRSLWTAWDMATKGMVPREELLSQPIKLRNALIFYLGHIPAFADIHLTRALREKATEPKAFQAMFERGIDPDVENPDHCHAHSEIPNEWPQLQEILTYQDKVRRRLETALQRNAPCDRTLAEAFWISFEHEAMHLETFLYMLLQSDRVLPPPGLETPDFKKMFRQARDAAKPNAWFTIPEQEISIGLDDSDHGAVPKSSFGWDNEKPQRAATVHAFEAQARPITNGEYAKYLHVNNCSTQPASWLSVGAEGRESTVNGNGCAADHEFNEFLSRFAVRTVYGPVPLKLAQDWPIMASLDELMDYANWMHCRIPTYEEVKSIYKYSAELKRKANQVTGHGNGPNGVNGANASASKLNGRSFEDAGPNGALLENHGGAQAPFPNDSPVFIDLDGCNVGFKHWHPVPIVQNGDKLAGQSKMGGVWEWTSTPLTRHDGFEAMEIYPGYTADFFDGKHYIIQGGSWATHPRIAGRTTFVNWYQHNYPYTWAGARLVRDLQ